LRLVSAFTQVPEDKKAFRDSFGEHAFGAFFQLYDQESTEDVPSDLFNFGPFQENAPHRPICVWHDRVYGSFAPLKHTLQLDAGNAKQVFEELFASIDNDLQPETGA
jgi:hypothetical protein